MMSVRDELNPQDKLYVVTPSPMMKWMQLYVQDSLKHPEMVMLVPSENLNPEDQYYYQEDHQEEDPEMMGEQILDEQVYKTVECVEKSKEHIDEVIRKFIPRCDKSKEMNDTVLQIMGLKVLSVEVEHCP